MSNLNIYRSLSFHNSQKILNQLFLLSSPIVEITVGSNLTQGSLFDLTFSRYDVQNLNFNGHDSNFMTCPHVMTAGVLL